MSAARLGALDPLLRGLDAYPQALEVDAGALKKRSFTQGLQLKLGK